MKSPDALKTIGEVSAELGVAQHILRYWEGRFPQLRPVTRAGNRRYYRPDDVALLRRIHDALNRDGYTVKGVQQMLAKGGNGATEAPAPMASQSAATAFPLDALRAISRQLREALAA